MLFSAARRGCGQSSALEALCADFCGFAPLHLHGKISAGAREPMSQIMPRSAVNRSCANPDIAFSSITPSSPRLRSRSSLTLLCPSRPAPLWVHRRHLRKAAAQRGSPGTSSEASPSKRQSCPRSLDRGHDASCGKAILLKTRCMTPGPEGVSPPRMGSNAGLSLAHQGTCGQQSRGFSPLAGQKQRRFCRMRLRKQLVY